MDVPTKEEASTIVIYVLAGSTTGVELVDKW
jgi:hypothetical protein